MSKRPQSDHKHTVRDLAMIATQSSSLILRAFAHIHTGVSMWDKQSCLLVANQRFYEIFGVSPQAAPVGTSYREFIEVACDRGALEGRDPDEFAEVALSLAARGASVAWDDEWPDGRIFTVEQRMDEQGGWICTYDEITSRRKAETQLAFLAQHDRLTTLPNRECFTTRLEEALARRRGVGLLMIDLDHVERVNEKLGPQAGDTLLRLVGTRLSNVFRQGDTVGRLGGDSFGILLGRTKGPEQTLACAQSVIALLRQPFEIDGRRLFLNASIGAATGPAHGGTAETLLRHADLALHSAKMEGGGTARLFEQEMAERVDAQRKMEADLRLAIKEGQLRLLYQPIVDSHTGRVASFEALMRWQHPQRGMIPPVAFIPLAEATGLIVPMGAWALRRACADAAKWPDHIKVAVNLSPAQFQSGDLCREVRLALEESILAPERLELEITESLLITETGAAKKMLKELHALGVHVAMDDFGTGYSSLSYLRDFAFDKIKIDKSFVDELGHNPSGDAVVRAVSRLAADLGVKTVAEGVENDQQRRHLRDEGCTYLQGYLFSKPRPVEEVPGLIATLGAQLVGQD
jgi:diguanylate cyclase (GGDEF)-like protein